MGDGMKAIPRLSVGRPMPEADYTPDPRSKHQRKTDARRAKLAGGEMPKCVQHPGVDVSRADYISTGRKRCPACVRARKLRLGNLSPSCLRGFDPSKRADTIQVRRYNP